MKAVIKENLERRFNSLLPFREDNRFILLEMDYNEYVGSNKVLGKMMNELIHEGRLHKPLLQNFYNLFMTGLARKREKVVFPTFFDTDIEKEFGLHKDFVKMIMDADAEIKAGKNKPADEIRKKVVETSKDFDYEYLIGNDMFYTQTLHNHLMEKLTSYEEKNNSLGFDSDSNLHFSGKNIRISKAGNSDSHHLLLTIFKNKEKVWNYDEIAEDWEEEYDPKDWNKYYNAGYEVNQKIAKETTIKDFLVITKKTVSINKKYL